MPKSVEPVMSFRDRIKSLKRVKSSDLLPNPANWRTHPREQQDALRGILTEVGIADAILVRETPEGLQIIDGHLRADLDPEVKWPCLVLDVDDAEAAKLLATFDPLSAMATIDSEKLDALLREIDTGSEALQQMLADLADEAGLYQDKQAEIIEDEVPEPPVDPITKPGDLWILGGHRILCGDSTKAEDVARLMNGEEADMVFTDPPYNVDYVGKTKQALKIVNDKMNDRKFREFLSSVYACLFASTKPGGALYVCHASRESVNFISSAESSGWMIKQCLIWVKNTMVLGRQDYQWKHEPILYGWKPGAPHSWHGNRKKTTVLDDGYGVSIEDFEADATIITITTERGTTVIKASGVEMIQQNEASIETIWRVPKPRRNKEHPTMKPVRVPAIGIENSSQSNEIVLDLFIGSGSTLSAAEQLRRRCFGMELDARFCDVAVTRWESLTGKKATLETPSR